ncbi:hypothetical protein JTB14_029047 [Gonioctena quinquepunctata]|nr:hypothetical protein JTB14_029047 [Gonioctena quinquepunctata]
MKSRIPAAVHLTAEKVLKKTVRNDGKVNVIQWFDEKPTLLASTALGQHPTDNYKRWSKKDSKGGLTLEEALQMAYSDDLDVRNIYVEPPDVNDLTDENSGEKDEGGLVDNLSRNQLKTSAQ